VPPPAFRNVNAFVASSFLPGFSLLVAFFFDAMYFSFEDKSALAHRSDERLYALWSPKSSAIVERGYPA